MLSDGSARVLVFRVGSERFAVDLSAVDEVVEAATIHAVPDAPPALLGITTIRGELVQVIDPRPVLNVEGPVDGAVLLFTRDDRRIGVAIDDVYDPLTLELSEVRPVPGADGSEDVVLGLVRRESHLIALLDVAGLLDAATTVSEPEGGRT